MCAVTKESNMLVALGYLLSLDLDLVLFTLGPQRHQLLLLRDASLRR